MDYQTIYRMSSDEWARFSGLLGRRGLYTDNFLHTDLGQVTGVYDTEGKIRKINDRARAIYDATKDMLYILDLTANLDHIIREVSLQ